MIDEFRVLPHRDVLTTYSRAAGERIYEHRPCGLYLSGGDVEANWCPNCEAVINKAAYKREKAARLPRGV